LKNVDVGKPVLVVEDGVVEPLEVENLVLALVAVLEVLLLVIVLDEVAPVLALVAVLEVLLLVIVLDEVTLVLLAVAVVAGTALEVWI